MIQTETNAEEKKPVPIALYSGCQLCKFASFLPGNRFPQTVQCQALGYLTERNQCESFEASSAGNFVQDKAS